MKIRDICEILIEERNNEKDIARPDSKKWLAMRDEFSKTLDENQKRKLCELEDLSTLIDLKFSDEKSKDCAERGFKAAIRLIIDSMRDE